jgi:DNA-directed RNA polymerase subunit RPC12/RpoP
MNDDNVIEIGVKFNDPKPLDQIFEVVTELKHCNHLFRIDPESDTVYCAKCSKTFSPMHVLLELARQERRWIDARTRYEDQMAELRKRKRTKCQHCGGITTISRKR